MMFHKNILVVVLIAIVLSMSVGGVVSSQMMSDGMMVGCPSMGVDAICTMTPLQHFSQWQDMFAATAQHMTYISVLLLLALAMTLSTLLSFALPVVPLVKFVSRYRYREKTFHSMRLALARGIIHPKAF